MSEERKYRVSEIKFKELIEPIIKREKRNQEGR